MTRRFFASLIIFYSACAPQESQPLREAVVEIGPLGGQVSFEGLTLDVPPTALAETTTITARFADTALGGVLCPTYEVLPHGLMFLRPATMRLKLCQQAQHASWPLHIYTRIDGVRAPITGSKRDAGHVVGDIMHLSS